MLNHARVQYLERHRASVGGVPDDDDRQASVGESFLGKSGLEYLDAISKLPPGVARERVVLDWVRARAMPPSLRDYDSWPWVTLTDGKNKLEIQVSPDFWKLGTDEASAAMAPMWPTTAQAVADDLSLRTINTKIANAIYRQAKVKGDIMSSLVNPGEPWYNLKNGTPRDIDASGAIAASDKKRIFWLEKVAPGDRKGILIDGHAKNVVHQGPGLSGDRVAIYGGGGGAVDGWAVQPFPGPHELNYWPDYSHGVRFMRKKALLNGKKILIDDVFVDPKLAHLVSDKGPYSPRMKAPSDEALKVAKIDLPRSSPLLPMGVIGDGEPFVADLDPATRSPEEDARVLQELDRAEPTAPKAPLTDAELAASAAEGASDLKLGLMVGGALGGLWLLWWLVSGITHVETLP